MQRTYKNSFSKEAIALDFLRYKEIKNYGTLNWDDILNHILLLISDHIDQYGSTTANQMKTIIEEHPKRIIVTQLSIIRRNTDYCAE